MLGFNRGRVCNGNPVGRARGARALRRCNPFISRTYAPGQTGFGLWSDEPRGFSTRLILRGLWRGTARLCRPFSRRLRGE